MFLVGIDGGGSACRAAVADRDGRVLGAATGPAANPTTDFDAAVASLAATLDAALWQAGLDRQALRSARGHAGLAGVIDDAVAGRVRAALPVARLRVTDDRPTNMRGALGRRDGAVAAIGTGSFLGRQSGGERRFAGGWGLVLGDEASGAWLGRGILAAALLAEDGLLAPSPLTVALLEDTGGPGGAVIFARDAAPPDFAALAPRVVEAAAQGDANALALMRDGAEYVRRALTALGFRGGEPLCLMGSLGPHYAGYLGPDLTAGLTRPEGSALDGALALAAEMPAD